MLYEDILLNQKLQKLQKLDLVISEFHGENSEKIVESLFMVILNKKFELNFLRI